MGLFIEQEKRSELQERLAAELREKAARKAKEGDVSRPDGVTDSAYLKDTQQTSSSAIWWIALVVIIIGGIILFAILR